MLIYQSIKPLYLNKGIAAEYLFDYECIKRGIRVSKPICDMPYDRVIDVDGRMIRVQIKSTGTIRRDRKSISYRVALHNGAKQSYGNNIDFFAIYVESKNQWVFIPIELAPNRFTCITEEGKYKDCFNNWNNLK